jgi:fructuronate reductase
MARLCAATLADAARVVRRPRYDRARLAVGMAHIGVGAFHRCHQAEYTDDALEAEFGPWGVVGVNIREPSLGTSLGVQDGLYTRALRDENGVDLRIIGCIHGIIDAQDEVEPALAALSAPRIGIITMTVTEKGYCHRPATGCLDESHPDVVRDLAAGAAPRSLPGVIVAALDRRRRTGAGGATLVSCDNIPANGRILASVINEFAARRAPDLVGWIADHVRFPSTMVDRIAPAPTSRDLAFAAETCGLEDRAAVVGEPFRQWAIEDDFLGARPRWEAAGAEFVRDVTSHELIKMRLLNAAQSTFAYFGALSGLHYTYDDVRDPTLCDFVHRMLVRETAPCLPTNSGVDIDAYIAQTFGRLRNAEIAHRNHQIATDGSQKIVQRLLNPIRDCIARGLSFDRLAAAVAAWMTYLCAASPRYGARWTPADPFAGRVLDIANETAADFPTLAARIIEIEPVFGVDLRKNEVFCAVVAGHLEAFLSDDPRPRMSALAAEATPG